MEYKEPYIIAEICGNHCGQIEIAKELISAAALAGASAAKFQKRCAKELLTPEQYVAPHPNPRHAYGSTYGEHREFLEFDIATHVDLYLYCKEKGIEYSTSVWDMTSAKEVVKEINPSFIKIPSACNTNYDMLAYLRDNYEGTIHISLGMTTLEEEMTIHEAFIHCPERLVIYACTSGYPVPFDKVCLNEVTRLCFDRKWMDCGIGFSGHHLGIAVDIAAYTLGAQYIERHFTMDRTWKGTDHSASLEPRGLYNLCRDLRATRSALTYKPFVMDPIEAEQRNKLKYRKR